MYIVRAIAIIAVVSLISGCGTVARKVTPEQTAASSRFYPGKSAVELKSAAEKALTLLAPDRIRVEVKDNEVRARHSYSYIANRIGYVGSTTSFSKVQAQGATWYDVTFDEEAGGTRARFTYLNAEPAGMFHPGLKSNLPVTADNNIDDFKLFHDRLEYLVGLRAAWTPCPSAPVAERQFIELCDQVGLQNAAP